MVMDHLKLINVQKAKTTNAYRGLIKKVKQSRYRPGVAQRIPGS
jgi:hypothetical protein